MQCTMQAAIFPFVRSTALLPTLEQPASCGCIVFVARLPVRLGVAPSLTEAKELSDLWAVPYSTPIDASSPWETAFGQRIEVQRMLAELGDEWRALVSKWSEDVS
jgi:hypothetical protein